jgi:hypothetical protein
MSELWFTKVLVSSLIKDFLSPYVSAMKSRLALPLDATEPFSFSPETIRLLREVHSSLRERTELFMMEEAGKPAIRLPGLLDPI